MIVARLPKVPAGTLGLIELKSEVSVKARRFNNDGVSKPDGDNDNRWQASCSVTQGWGPNILAIKELSGERGGAGKVNGLM